MGVHVGAPSSAVAAPEKPPKGHFFFAHRVFPRATWYKRPNMRRLYIYIVVLIATNTANGFDGSMMNGLQTLSYWQNFFDHPHGSLLGLFNASMSLGSIVGQLPVPYLIDWYGRKLGLFVGCLIMLLAIGLQSGAQNFGMFIAARLVLGFGNTIVMGAAPLLIAEIAHPQDRAVLVTLSASSYQSGAFIASWVTYGTLQIQSDWAWRLPSLLQGLCTIVILATLFWIPESPRWLIYKNRVDEARDILVRYHAEGDADDEFVQLEFSEIKIAIAMDKEANQTAWLDLVRTPGNRKRIGIITALAFFSQWSGNGLISYYLTYVMDAVGISSAQTQLGVNAGMNTLGLVVNIGLSFVADLFGRRPLYLASTIGTLVAFVPWTIISARSDIAPSKGLAAAFILFTYLYTIAYGIKSGIMANYTTEILPYGLRAKGYTWLNFCVCLALFFNQYINGIALDAIHWKYYIVYCVFITFEIWVIWAFVIETRYTPMEEIARFFDGPDAVDIGEVAVAGVKESGLDLGDAADVKSAQLPAVREVE
ncbi:hexose transporter [Sporothrix schenckii 1099-18]|uniref:Hexose transporter n=1 Tax=Sporothrix schenckii 1099-18 TaxID=1397361 RepID=A0A0F2M9C5_SPOSC|nr:hexose transporter [Sporothrix schenckii 1099-18]KJR86242.1 hexose transporter [Sporothrix schenckii 1099-18]